MSRFEPSRMTISNVSSSFYRKIAYIERHTLHSCRCQLPLPRERGLYSYSYFGSGFATLIFSSKMHHLFFARYVPMVLKDFLQLVQVLPPTPPSSDNTNRGRDSNPQQGMACSDATVPIQVLVVPSLHSRSTCAWKRQPARTTRRTPLLCNTRLDPTPSPCMAAPIHVSPAPSTVVDLPFSKSP